MRSANFLVLVPGIPAQSATKVADCSPSGSPCSNQLRPDGLASWTAIAWALLTKQPLAEFVGLFGCGRIKVGAFKWSCGPREWEVTGPEKRAGTYAPIGTCGAIFPPKGKRLSPFGASAARMVAQRGQSFQRNYFLLQKTLYRIFGRYSQRV